MKAHKVIDDFWNVFWTIIWIALVVSLTAFAVVLLWSEVLERI